MNLKDNKGITLLALVIMIVILAILTYSVVNISMNMTDTAKFENVESNMLLIQSKCEIRENEIAIGNTELERYGEPREITIDGVTATLYRLSQADLIEMGIKDAKEGYTQSEIDEIEQKKDDTQDVYYVDYPPEGSTQDIDVIYQKGVVNSGEIYTRLSDILNAGK